MKNTNLKSAAILSVLALAGTFSFVNGQTISTDVKATPKVEISVPIQKDEFLLFYGVTSDAEVNAEISDLRKDFAEKFDNLKDEYKKSFNEVVGDTELKPGVPEEKVEEVKPAAAPVALKASATARVAPETKTVKETAATVTNTVKKYIIEDTKNAVITPLVNIVNEKSTVKTEASSWFQKIKSWFGW